MLQVNAAEPRTAMTRFEKEWGLVLQAIASGHQGGVDRQLAHAAEQFRAIGLKRPVEAVPVIALVGEIFVRHDGLSRQYITEHLARRGFACVCAPVAEWIHYTDWLVANGHCTNGQMTWRKRVGLMLKRHRMQKTETRIKQTLARSGLIQRKGVDIPEILRHAHPHLPPDHLGEAILTVGSAMREVVSHACGVIAIGPFGCMPNRMAESMLNELMTASDKMKTTPGNRRLKARLVGMKDLPFLAIETDGSPFPQIIHAKLDAFCLRARHLHERLQAMGESDQATGVDSGSSLTG